MFTEYNNARISVPDALTRALTGQGAPRLLVALGVAAVVIGILIYLATRLSVPAMSLLYADLDQGDANKIVAKLEGMTVDYDLRAGGSAIFVPSDSAVRLRMALAEEGLPSGGSIGYEVFDRSDTLGTTRSMQNINLLRALEGELARTIRSLSRISAARVHLVLPKRDLFSRERREPSASIVLSVVGSARLNRAQVTAIQHLVAAAVPGLNSSRVSIIDTHGTLLARGEDGTDDSSVVGIAAQDYRSSIETRIKHMIEGLLERSMGFGKVRAEVTAEIDFTRVTTSAETFDPDSQVARSTQLVEEETSSSEPGGTETVSISQNLPGATTEETIGTAGGSTTARTEETTNYEISKIVRNLVLESGTIKRLSVAVLVDGTYTTETNGERTYQPRSAEEIEQLVTLVRSAIGFDPERGDSVEIVNMVFTSVEVPEIGEPSMLGFGKGDYFKVAEIVVLFIVGLLVVLLVLRPLATHALTLRPATAAEGAAQAALPTGSGKTPAQLTAEAEADEEDDPGIDFDRIKGKVKESSIKKIGEIVDNHPEEALAIIRNWLYQEA